MATERPARGPNLEIREILKILKDQTQLLLRLDEVAEDIQGMSDEFLGVLSKHSLLKADLGAALLTVLTGYSLDVKALKKQVSDLKTHRVALESQLEQNETRLSEETIQLQSEKVDLQRRLVTLADELRANEDIRGELEAKLKMQESTARTDVRECWFDLNVSNKPDLCQDREAGRELEREAEQYRATIAGLEKELTSIRGAVDLKDKEVLEYKKKEGELKKTVNDLQNELFLLKERHQQTEKQLQQADGEVARRVQEADEKRTHQQETPSLC